MADRPFVDRPPGDLAAATRLAERVTNDLELPSPTLANVGMNAIFSAGDVVVRVGRPTAPAASSYDLAEMLAATGVRVPRPAVGRPVVVDDDNSAQPLVATVWERVVASGEIDWFDVGKMVRRVNELAIDSVPGTYPAPLCTVYPWWQFDGMLRDVAGDIDGDALAGLSDAVERNRGWVSASGGPVEWVLCHGDVHTDNVIASADGPVIVDWDLLCVGPPAWDHAPLRSMVQRWGADPRYYDRFAAGYGADLSDDAIADSLTQLRLVAATLMRVIAGRDDPVARAEAERRLRFWRGDPDAPTWVMS